MNYEKAAKQLGYNSVTDMLNDIENNSVDLEQLLIDARLLNAKTINLKSKIICDRIDYELKNKGGE